ncbi:MAG: protein kinase [Gemmatimonadales bacterium]
MTTLGPYTILEKIGSGGMGEVFRAHDPRLGRDVALKTLLPELSADAERRVRFEREARAVAALNHPNIVTLYSIESHGDVHFLTMELVSGVTLSAAIPPGGLPLDRFFEIALPLADAIGTAHEHGVTHRDLKPANVMVTEQGRVKVLDFGLAKLRPRLFGENDDTAMLSEARTMRGQVLGTPSYMSPEQAEGREIDHRTDIFSLGVLLHEMLTGRRPFTGGSTASILSSLLRDTPQPVTDVRPDVPGRLSRLVQRALEKDPLVRYQSIADLRSDLADIRKELQAGEIGAPKPGMPRWLRLGMVIAAGLVLITGVVGYYLSPNSPGTAVLGDVEFSQLTHAAGEELFPSLSPDGQALAYASARSGNFDIYWQRVGGENPVNLTRDSPADDTQPAFTPDGQRVAFRSERDGGGIFMVGATGESVKRLTDFGYHPAWSRDGTRLAIVTQSVSDPALRFTASEMWILTPATGQRRRLGQGDAVQPSWSPSGRRIAYWSRSGPTATGDIWTIPSDGGTPVAVTSDPSLDWNPVWSPDGRHIYFSSNRGGTMNLWRIEVDEESGKAIGRPVPVTTGGGATSQHATISADGRRVAYVARVESMNLQRVGFDPVAGVIKGSGEWVTSGSRATAQPHLSRDGRRIAYNTSGKQEDIFAVNTDGTGQQQLTDDLHQDRAARWSPDGERVAFYTNRTGAYEIWTIARDGSDLRQLTRSPGAHYPVWSPDGRSMAYSTHSPNGAFVFDVNVPWDQQKPRQLPLLPDPSQTFEIWGWSADGRWLAGQKHLADLSHAGVAIHEIGSTRIEWLTDFGEWPVWMHDNRRLLFSHHGQLFLIDRTTGKYRQVLSLPQQMLGSVALSPDERSIYYTVMAAEADVWLVTLK